VTADDLTSQVSALTAAAVDLAHELDFDDLAARVDTELVPAGEGAASVVVVGEKKRGKSSLINALLGHEDLLPVDVDVATSCYLAVQHAAEPRVIAYSADAPEGIEIGLDDIGEYASLEGNRDPLDPDRVLHEDVTAVEVFLDDPMLASGLTLIDTPGVGGLEAGHTEITLATLRRANALLFVVDPDSPLKAPELHFLGRATDRIATVVFVMTKTDLYPGWRQILTDDQALIAKHAPRYETCTWVPVSSALRLDALRASERGDLARADELLQRSGFPTLEQSLRTEVVDRVGLLHLANALQSARTVLGRMASVEEARIRSATGDPRLADELEEKQATLARLSQQNAAWRGDCNDGFRRLETNVHADLQRRLRQVRRGAEDRIAVWEPLLLDTLPTDLVAGIQAVWIDLTTAIRQEAITLYLSVAQEFAQDGVGVLTEDVAVPDWVEAIPPISRTAEETRGLFDEYGREGLTAMGAALMVGKVLALGPVGMALAGAGLLSAMLGGRRQREQRLSGQRDASRWVQRTTEDAALELATALKATIADVQQRTEAVITERLASRRTELEAEIVDHKQHLRADQSERNRIRVEGEGRLARIDELASAVDGLAGELSLAVEQRRT
jgi:GTPase SAR1 family protein